MIGNAVVGCAILMLFLFNLRENVRPVMVRFTNGLKRGELRNGERRKGLTGYRTGGGCGV
jgi:hypothetical protein